MRYRRFGKTDLNLSIFTLGTKRLAFPGTDPDREAKTQRAVETIHRAVALGVNHVVTARSYGNSDDLVGLALKGLDRSKIHLSTKIPICNSADDMKAQMEDTLKRLGVDFIDVLTLHGVNESQCLNKVTSPTGCMKAVEEAQAQGTVKHLAFSTYGPLEFILKALDTELFDAIHVHFGYFNQRNTKVIEKAAQMDIGVLVTSPTERGGALLDPPPLMQELCEPFHPAVVNDRFILQYAPATSLTVVASGPDELNVHEPVFDNDGPLSDAETLALAQMDVRRLQLPGTWCTHCFECLPCPEDVNIPEVLRLRNMALAYGMTGFFRAQYAWLGSTTDHGYFQGHQGDHCTECGDCLPRCPEKLDIPKLLLETHRLPLGSGKKRTLKSGSSNRYG